VTSSTPNFDRLLAVAAATLRDDGTLLSANAGFLRLLEADAAEAIGAPVAYSFIQPAFATLAAATPDGSGQVHCGLMTMGRYEGRTRSLRGTVWREGARLRLLAEHDIADLERLNDAVLALNRDYADAQLRLTQANLAMRQLNTLLSNQKAELQATLDRIKRLEGLLTICMYCKKIRAEHNDWQRLERYLAEHSDATFSHGMCPECHERMMQHVDEVE
jgi:hypothetical protein